MFLAGEWLIRIYTHVQHKTLHLLIFTLVTSEIYLHLGKKYIKTLKYSCMVHGADGTTLYIRNHDSSTQDQPTLFCSPGSAGFDAILLLDSDKLLSVSCGHQRFVLTL